MGFEKSQVQYANNGVNVPLAWAMFGGSTFILFLLCYFCQKKLQDEDMAVVDPVAPSQVYVIPAANTAFQNVPPLPSPPPDYNSVVKKDPVFQFEDDPPSYDTAIASLACEKLNTVYKLPNSQANT